MKKKSYRRKRGPVQAKKVTYDGIKFASGLEKYMYQAIKKAKLKAVYEGVTFEVSTGFNFENLSYERTANYHYIIECKGRANESFPLRWKLFKKYVSENLPYTTLFKPQNQKECDQVVKIILDWQK